MEGETEAQGGDRICKLVLELGCKHGTLGSWLFVLLMTQAAFVIMKRAGRHILVPGAKLRHSSSARPRNGQERGGV